LQENELKTDCGVGAAFAKSRDIEGLIMNETTITRDREMNQTNSNEDVFWVALRLAFGLAAVVAFLAAAMHA
jgi:hypothetical protein